MPRARRRPRRGRGQPDATAVPLREHIEALREADQRAIEMSRQWVAERLESHNKLLEKWQEATARDRGQFATVEAVVALKEAFELYKEITAKALTLAEGKSTGIDSVRVVVVTLVTVVGVLLAAWVAFGPSLPTAVN